MFYQKRILLYGRNLDYLHKILPDNLQIVTENPDLVISYGGDGFLLGAEREYPNVAKLPIRDYHSNPKCAQHHEKNVIKLALENKLSAETFIKLEAYDESGNKIIAVNDIVLHNRDARSAIRYRIWIDGKPFLRQIVGDGLVVATPFGSTAYYKSITGSTFSVGIGVAFNNSTEQMDHLVLSPEMQLEVMIMRGPATLYGDNSPEEFHVETGQKIFIRRIESMATFHGLDIFRCPECYALRRKLWQEELRHS